MKKLLLIVAGAMAMEILAMEVKVMNLPAQAGTIFGTLAALLVLVAVWEKPKPDERDQVMHWRSSHIAWLTTASVLIGILMYQTLATAVEPWTVAAVGALIVGKIIGRVVAKRRMS